MRNTSRIAWLAVAALAAASLLGTGCGKKKTPEAPPPAPVEKPTTAPITPPAPVERPVETEPFPSEAVDRAEPAVPSIDELNRQGVLRTVYFGYDSSELDSEARATLQANADWLNANASYRAVVAGHCDERGTIEYNLALGLRRAESAIGYLSSLGVPVSRLRPTSFGEERPADPGHGDDAWSKNRRAEFTIEP